MYINDFITQGMGVEVWGLWVGVSGFGAWFAGSTYHTYHTYYTFSYKRLMMRFVVTIGIDYSWIEVSGRARMGCGTCTGQHPAVSVERPTANTTAAAAPNKLKTIVQGKCGCNNTQHFYWWWAGTGFMVLARFLYCSLGSYSSMAAVPVPWTLF